MTDEVKTAPGTIRAKPKPVRRAVMGLLGTARDIALASIGVVGVLADDVTSLYSRSVERGQDHVRNMEEKLGLIGKMPRVPRPARSTKPGREVSEYASAEWRAALAKLNVASPQDVELLAEQVAQLEAKVNLLTGQQAPE